MIRSIESTVKTILKLKHLHFGMSSTVDLRLEHIPGNFFHVDLLPVSMKKN